MTKIKIQYSELNMEQGSNEWIAARKGKVTASQLDKLLTPAKLEKSKQFEDFLYTSIAEIVSDYTKDNITTFAMERGKELEPIAREVYMQENFCNVRTVGFLDCGDYGYSPDGLIDDEKKIIEIKCPLGNTHTKYLINNDMFIKDYNLQIQMGLLITGFDSCDLISYNPDFYDHKHQLLVINVKRDEDVILRIYNILQTFIEAKQVMLSSLSLLTDNDNA